MNTTIDALHDYTALAAEVSITDLFSVEELQRIQDAFADATGVASLITYPDGTPVTQPSNFCRLCRDIIRATECGRENCFRSDAAIGKQNPSGPIIQTCLSGGLWDAGASISVAGRHIGNWLIGQVKDSTFDLERLVDYADQIGADRNEYRAALLEVPVMSPDQFEKIASLVFLLSNELSQRAFHNLQQAQMIAERKRADEQIKASQRWFRVTLTSIGDAVMTTDTKGRVTFINPVASSLTGWEPAEAEGRPIEQVFRIINEQSRETGENVVAKVLRERRTAELANHTALVAKDGREIPIEDSAAPILDDSGKVLGVVLVFHDVTEKRRAQKRLQESAQRYRALVQMSPDGILVHRNNRIEFVNPAAMKLLGASSPDELVGRSPFDVYHPEYHAVIRERVEQLKKGVAVPLLEEKLVRLDGQVVDVAVAASPFVDQQGPAIQVILQDITERKRADEALLRSEKLASVGRMAASIAHEINNPLAAVMNLLYLTRTSLDNPELAHEYLDTADDELKRISHITRQTLGFYRESSSCALVSINSVVDSAVDLLRGKIKLKRTAIEREYDGEFSTHAVAGELRQVFSNILANSLDAIAEGGKIRVRIARATCARTGQSRIKVTIADNGRGIAASVLPRIFEPLFTTKEATGSGLGLWISRQLVDRHGGSIRLRSRTQSVGGGTVFCVLLPVNA
jgi:two-component system cell cycle sensor histidine kinase/response regulator CckA